MMASFDPYAFASTLQKYLPNAHVSVQHHTDEERKAVWAVLHALNSRWNHALPLGHGILTNQKSPEKK